LLRRLFVQDGIAVDLVGLGNSLNDLPLLLAVDRPVLVRKKDGSFEPEINIPSLERTRGSGPAGWNEAVLKVLSDDE
jgi:mannosyl-3-phosphoglycerate phosphatase